MIASLTGTITRKAPDYCVIDVAGVGYQVQVPLATFYRMPDEGGGMTLHIHTHLREDAISLFGFSDQAQKDLFLTLLAVSGIGPRLALAVLSSLSVDEIITAITTSNEEKLSSVPGIGKKTAARIVLELKDKLRQVAPAGGRFPEAGAGDTAAEDVLSALVNLGYKRSQAEEAVRKVRQTRPGLGVEALIRESLALLSRA